MATKTLVLIKPDAFANKCANEILKRFLDAGLELRAAKKIRVDAELVARHYQDRFAKSPEFKDSVTEYLMSGPVLVLVLEHENAVELARIIIGPLGGGRKGTIRGDFSSDLLHSLVHGSDSAKAAEYEIRVWFPKWDVAEYPEGEKEVRMKSFSDLKPAEKHFVEAVVTKMNGHDLHAQASAQRCLSALIGKESAEDTASGHVVEFGRRKVCLPDFLHVETALKRFREIGINI